VELGFGIYSIRKRGSRRVPSKRKGPKAPAWKQMRGAARENKLEIKAMAPEAKKSVTWEEENLLKTRAIIEGGLWNEQKGLLKI